MEQDKIKEEVWQRIKSLNQAWAAEGNPAELKNYFHRDMVAVTATDRLRLEGREACLAGWQGFVEATKIHYFKEIDPQVQVYGEGKFAVVTYYYDMSFDMGGQTIHSSGRDMFALLKEDGTWWVVADHFSPYPGE